MTLTTKTMEWLNQNRHRSYPMVRDEWRSMISPESGLDCVILDALVFNNDASGDEELELVSVEVLQSNAVITMKYSGIEFVIDDIVGGSTSGEGSYDRRMMSIGCDGMRDATISIILSSHAYMLDVIGTGKWEIGCRVLKSRIVSLSDGFGVDFIRTNGSTCVDGHDHPSDAKGDVVLEDGFRTSPIITNGKIRVRVGRRYGIDPCHYSCGGSGAADCESPLFFFCGQNAINGGNVSIKGGYGITVKQGRSYKLKSGKRAGKEIPCVEIVAGTELMDIYKPSATDRSLDVV